MMHDRFGVALACAACAMTVLAGDPPAPPTANLYGIGLIDDVYHLVEIDLDDASQTILFAFDGPDGLQSSGLAWHAPTQRFVAVATDGGLLPASLVFIDPATQDVEAVPITAFDGMGFIRIAGVAARPLDQGIYVNFGTDPAITTEDRVAAIAPNGALIALSPSIGPDYDQIAHDPNDDRIIIFNFNGVPPEATQISLPLNNPNPDVLFNPAFSQTTLDPAIQPGTATIYAVRHDAPPGDLVIVNPGAYVSVGDFDLLRPQGIAFAPPIVPMGCPEDLDGNGSIDSADLNALLAAFGSTDGGDIDGDGDTDSADLNLLLAAFGDDCAP